MQPPSGANRARKKRSFCIDIRLILYKVLLFAFVLLILPSCSFAGRSIDPRAGRGVDPRSVKSTLYIGTYFDKPASENSDDQPDSKNFKRMRHIVKPISIPKKSQLMRYLVEPMMRSCGQDTSGEIDADSLSECIVEKYLKRNREFKEKVHLSFDEDDDKGCDVAASIPLAFHISRAQHETIRFSARPQSGIPVQYRTEITMSVSANMFRLNGNPLCFENVYSRLIVGTRVLVQDHTLPSPPRLEKEYLEAFTKLFDNLLDLVKEDFSGSSTRTEVLFQISSFAGLKAKKIPSEISQLFASEAHNRGDSIDQELDLFRNELKHTLSQILSMELKRQGINDIVLMPPTSGWALDTASCDIIDRLVSGRAGSNAEYRTYVDPEKEQVRGHQAIGFEVKSVLRAINTKLAQRNAIMRDDITGVVIATRIYRPQKDRKPKLVPVSLPEEKRTIQVTGTKEFRTTDGMKRFTTKGVVLESFRNAFLKLAPKVVKLMLEVKKNRYHNI